MRSSLLILGTGVFTAVLYELLPVGLLTPIADELRVSEQDAGLLISAFSVLVVLGSIPLSAVTARFDARVTLAVVLGTFAVSAGVMSLSSSLAVAVAARALGGLAHAVLFTALYRIALSIVPSHRRAVVATTVSTGNALALALGVPLATVLGNAGSWRLPFGLAAVVFAILAVAGLLLLPPAEGAEDDRFSPGAVLRAAVEAGLLRVALTTVVMLGAQFLTYTYVEPLLLSAGVMEENVGLVLFGYGIASVIGLALVTRFTHTRPSASLRVALALILIALVLLWLGADSAVGVSAAVVFWGAGFGMMPVLLQVLSLRASPTLPEASAPVANTAFNIGITLGALVGGLLISVVGTEGLSLVSAVILAVIAVVAFLPGWLPRDRGGPRAQ